MSIELELHADEESTYKTTAAFTDAAGDAVTPKSVEWTLSDMEGTVINSRLSVSETPASSVDIVLSGDDLALQTSEVGTVKRLLTVVAVYDSTEGTDLPLNEEAVFLLDSLVKIPFP